LSASPWKTSEQYYVEGGVKKAEYEEEAGGVLMKKHMGQYETSTIQ